MFSHGSVTQFTKLNHIALSNFVWDRYSTRWKRKRKGKGRKVKETRWKKRLNRPFSSISKPNGLEYDVLLTLCADIIKKSYSSRGLVTSRMKPIVSMGR